MTVVAQHQGRTETVLKLAGCFDATAFRELHEALGRMDRAAHVTIDFHDVRLLQDSTVGLIATELSGAPQVSLVGLSEHHHRLLRYLGAPAARS